MLVGCNIFQSHFKHNHEVVCEGASQGGGSGRPTAEVHEHDMTNTGTGKSGYIVEY